jgi:hypothetical protein
MPGYKHLIECHCYLKIYNLNEKNLNHKFPVYSKVDINNKVVPKFVKCNNCESLHYVYDICKSELRGGKEDTQITTSIDDLVLMLPDKLTNLLNKLKCDISIWEHCLDVIEEKRWGESIVVKREIIDENYQLKILDINSENNFKIKNKTIESIIVLEE